MPLTQEQIQRLNEAIIGYNFPAVYFDFNNNIEIVAQNMTDVETVIAAQLRSQEGIITKHGLANVLYWGYANIGYQKIRVNDFLNKVTSQQVKDFQDLIDDAGMPTTTAVKSIGMPQYSGMSFVSKILMFLNPNDYCVLDQQLSKLRTLGSPKSLNRLKFKSTETQIRISWHNNEIYDEWRNECSAISRLYFQETYRVVDIERGFFNLIQNSDLLDARVIYNNA